MTPDDVVPFEVVGSPRAGGPFVLTCEHASNATPGVKVTADDRGLLVDHWGYDLGAAEVTRALAERTGSPAVLSTFSRLLVDPNRHPAEPSLIVSSCDDVRVSFNAAVDDEERDRRLRELYQPFHGAIDDVLTRALAVRPVHLVSIHSFTPVWLGRPRAVEVGVLFDEHHEDAAVLEAGLAEQGFETSLNEPYSGKTGLIYSAARHGRGHGVPFLELEIRNDLLATPEQAQKIAERIAEALTHFEPVHDGWSEGMRPSST